MEKVKSNALAETRRLVSNSMSKADEIVDKMKDLLSQASDGALLEAKKLRHKLAEIEDEVNKEDDFTQFVPLPLEKIKVGEPCVVISLKSKGVLKSTPDKKNMVTVALGSIMTKVKTSDLGMVFAEKEKKVTVKNIKPATPRPITTFLTELKVLGMTVDEAIGEIEPYLISMHENEGNKTIKIVHGKGTMALAKGLHRYFKSLPIVDEFRYGRYGEGDNGVTFVTVK